MSIYYTRILCRNWENSFYLFPVVNNKIFIASWVSEDQNQWLTIAIQEGKKKKNNTFFNGCAGSVFQFYPDVHSFYS